MATYTKETALFDTGAIGNAIDGVEKQINIGLYGEDGNGGVTAQISLKLDKVSGIDNTDLISNINAIADQINLSAENINFGSTNVKEELTKYNASVSIDTDPQNPNVRIGQSDDFHIKITKSALEFWQGEEDDENTNRVAYITNHQLYIEQSVVLQQMDVGTSIANGGLGKWSWRVHPNNEDPPRNNLNLKWIG